MSLTKSFLLISLFSLTANHVILPAAAADDYASAKRRKITPPGQSELFNIANYGSIEELRAKLAPHPRINVNQQNYASLSTPLLGAIARDDGNCLPFVTTLLAARANPNCVNKEGFTALHKAALFNDPDVIQTLVAAGADISAQNPSTQQTPEAMAREIGCSAAADQLQSIRIQRTAQLIRASVTLADGNIYSIINKYLS